MRATSGLNKTVELSMPGTYTIKAVTYDTKGRVATVVRQITLE